MFFNEKVKRLLALSLLIICIFSTAMADQFGDFYYFVFDNQAEITGYIDTSVTTLRIPEQINGYDVTSIHNLRGCTKIVTVELPTTITEFIENPFSDCENLSDIRFSPNNHRFVTRDGCLFDQEEQRLLVYFRGNKADHFSIPEGTDEIGFGAFMNCSTLKKITIPKSVQRIDRDAFANCDGLTEINIPHEGRLDMASSGNPFWGCDNLQTISFVSYSDPNYIQMNEMLFYTINQTMLSYLPYYQNKEYEIPSFVKKIGIDAFRGNSQIESIIIPDNVEEIRSGAFTDCTQLKNVTISPNTKINNYSYVFSGCTNLENIFVYHDSPAEEYCIEMNLPYSYID